MKNSKILKVILFLLGLLLFALGSWRLTDPIVFFENSGIILADEPGLLNEVRSAGAVIAGFGLVILLGAFIQKLTYSSTIVAMVVFLGFAIGRSISAMIDGDPGNAIKQAIIIEFVFGLIATFALFKYRKES